MTPANSVHPTIPEFIKLLEVQIKNFQLEGRYAEAIVAQNRKDELVKNQEIRQQEQSRLWRVTQRALVEESQRKEFEICTNLYMEKLVALEEELNAQRKQLKWKHAEELKEFRFKIKETKFRPKFSAELLRLRKQQELLAKMQNYVEAHKIKLLADTCETSELAKSEKEKKQLIIKKEQAILDRQTAEVVSLEARLVTKRDSFIKGQQTEVQRMLKRFHNTLTDIDAPSKKPLVTTPPPGVVVTSRLTRLDGQNTARTTPRATSRSTISSSSDITAVSTLSSRTPSPTLITTTTTTPKVTPRSASAPRATTYSTTTTPRLSSSKATLHSIYKSPYAKHKALAADNAKPT